MIDPKSSSITAWEDGIKGMVFTTRAISCQFNMFAREMIKRDFDHFKNADIFHRIFAPSHLKFSKRESRQCKDIDSALNSESNSYVQSDSKNIISISQQRLEIPLYATGGKTVLTANGHSGQDWASHTWGFESSRRSFRTHLSESIMMAVKYIQIKNQLFNAQVPACDFTTVIGVILACSDQYFVLF